MPETMNGTPLTMPEGVQVESMTPTYGRFVVQPLERGYGVTIGNAFINTRAQFIVVRGILGGTESAVLPGNAYILARYYRRGELTVRISFFMFSAAYLASAVGGLLASAFISAKPIGVIHTWVSHGRSQRIHHY